MKLTIIYPTYNEGGVAERNLRRIYFNFRKIKVNPEVLIVDDSTDGSDLIFKKLQGKYKGLKFIHRNERGVGSAVRLGIERARGNCIIISMFDSPQEILYFPLIIDKFRDGYDLVQTSRFIGGATMIGYPLKKLIANRLGNRFIGLLFFRFDLTDFTSLFKGFRKNRISKLNLEANAFNLGLEISTKSIRKKYKIVEIPVDWIERDIGETKLILSKQIPRYLKLLMKIWLTYR